MFVKCEQADARNEVEARNATVTQLNASPVWRSGSPWGGNRLTSLDMTGNNTFWRKRDTNDDSPEAA